MPTSSYGIPEVQIFLRHITNCFLCSTLSAHSKTADQKYEYLLDHLAEDPDMSLPQQQLSMKPENRGNDTSCSSSNTDDYHDDDIRRRRFLKNRSR